MPILPLIWANLRLIAEAVAILAGVAVFWWFFIHNPNVIREKEKIIQQQEKEIKAAHDAINLLGTIERKHDEVNKNSERNIQIIYSDPKPARTGYFVLGGYLPGVSSAVHQANSSSRATPFNAASSARSGG